MPPRAPLQGSFSLTDINNEVVCPLRNHDSSSCRKRCLGEKRFRSMQEHIRRAHPEYYIPKLPATKESFELMITSPPHERPLQDTHGNAVQLPPPSQQQQQQQHQQHSDPSGLSPVFDLDPGAGLSSFEGYHALGSHDGGYYTAGDAEAAAIYSSMQAQQRSSDEYRRGSLIPAASAAAALAQLHYHRPDSADWGGDNNNIGQVITFPSMQISPTITEADFLQNFYADQHNDMKNHFHVDPALEDASFNLPDSGVAMTDHSSYPVSSSHEHGGLLPSSLAHSPPDRTPTLPPLQRSLSRPHGSSSGRPRKSSLLGQQARLGKHERRKSKDLAKRSSGDRKAFSAEPSAAALYGKRWEDLIDAATSATEEEGSRDLTPIPASPYQSPQNASRTSLPPFAMGSQFQSFQASPLNRALTPPAPEEDPHLADLQPFPSVDSSLSSSLSHHPHHHHHHHHSSADSTGSQFHIMHPASMDNSTSSPTTNNNLYSANASTAAPATAATVQIYCAGCRRLCVLKESYACTNCICGLCGNCVEAIISGQSRGRMSMCPRCNGMDSGFKPFQLDLR
ncbi:hypothetical protein LTR91_001212 [Friedmanniomyces endolithicus]|uniref:RING zinc finger-like domain-containing protein n=1 Tax=Friedmanniomyces endolithicus TaxID=329885 RepID=A0AAN6L164_9PEZI|nr:hypothetical protein LTR03_016432 [Friedmanniomyces endolithicus]KAK0843847.1 hypothetical protein LTS02_015949 [Friedmanniomyces endolithicus]KAK0862818.1 hypothetical protein LTR87_016447 [Friedmanniomyces endolithicus]KAK0896936.1 hypothetical protein LTR02_010965 [Friedmanniomyces endolithicus]KAK0929696.1 hypothetical protein LTR57_001552 [Friedmanniomyces endolithicus]